MSGTSMGLEQKIAYFISYVLGWITGLVVLLVEKDNKSVRFHAAQSIVIFGAVFVASIIAGFVPGIGGLLGTVIGLVGLALWIIMLVTSLQNKPLVLPVVSGFAEKI